MSELTRSIYQRNYIFAMSNELFWKSSGVGSTDCNVVYSPRFRLALQASKKRINSRDSLESTTERVRAVSCPRGARLAHGVVSGAREGKRVVQLPRSLTDKLTYANTASLRSVI